MRILIVDDDFSNRVLLQTLMGESGECTLEGSGKSALGAFVKALHDGAPFDLVLLDIVMPDLDGQELLLLIREAERRWGVEIGQETKVIMITSVSDPKEAIKSFFRGSATAYLVKPIDKHMLDGKIKELFAPPQMDEATAKA